jgi:uncharacterized protein (DUF362 family)/Pyruvate/2-oxoacid:ferredoxin oxidoreductase delta subunit
MQSTVSIVACADYSLEPVLRAVSDALDLAGGLEVAGRSVLVKPNMLASASPRQAVSTHPEFLRAVIRVLHARGARRILVGDSPAFQSTDAVGQWNGLKPVTLEEGAEWIDFDDPVEVQTPAARLVKRFTVARVVTEADLVISLCKLKTHGLMYFTGAVKNLFGIIPGLRKSSLHMRFPDRLEFGTMLADLTLAVRSSYAIMDGIVAMEGAGPYGGEARQLGLVLAGASLFAVDWVASSIIGYNPLDVPYLRAAADTPLNEAGDAPSPYGFDPAGITTAGLQPAAVQVKDFKRIQIVDDGKEGKKGLWTRLSRDIMVPRPVFSKKRCVLCLACVKMCPAKALSVGVSKTGSRSIAVDYSACIRCYCCHEVCPEHAIDLKRRL